MDEYEPTEQNLTSSPTVNTSTLTLQQAIDFGEYDPKYLTNFAQWHSLSPHIQWQMIRKALDIRHKQLVTQYAELNNALHLSKKPHVKAAMKSVEKQINKLMGNREDLYVEYSSKF